MSDQVASNSISTQSESNDGYIIGIVILLLALCFVSGLLIYFVYKKYNDELHLSRQIVHQVSRIKSRQMPKSGSVSKQTLDNIQAHASSIAANAHRQFLQSAAITDPNKTLPPNASKPPARPSPHIAININNSVNNNRNRCNNAPSSSMKPTKATNPANIPSTIPKIQNACNNSNPHQHAKQFQIQITQHQHNPHRDNKPAPQPNNHHSANEQVHASSNTRYKVNSTPNQQRSAAANQPRHAAPPRPPVVVSPAFNSQPPSNGPLLPYHYFQKYIQPAMQRETAGRGAHGQQHADGESKDGGIRKTELPPPPPPTRLLVPASKQQQGHKAEKPSLAGLSENASLDVPSLPVAVSVAADNGHGGKHYLSVHYPKHSRMLTASTYLSNLSEVTQSTAYTRVTKETQDTDHESDSEEHGLEHDHSDLSTIASSDSGNHDNRKMQYEQKQPMQLLHAHGRPMSGYGHGAQMSGHVGMQIDGNVHALRQTSMYHQ
eukprot:CAMPEP_0197022244 /NCGR_PEP_ID=MMETSP1384-20130603/3151_1 /TAXON_ID=29189 /ORGANISM="Ammonia sp." /LENGTH=489 /DNA_ID=CAMNT_0042450251 /DNA_START=44 /DNA_END=1513 /DNA_ORIENTATION=+